MRHATRDSATRPDGPSGSGEPAVARGFTLLELLVVIGIIGVLVALLLPSLSRARESARQVVCLSNIRQLSAAVLMYCNDNQGYFPNDSPRTPYALKMGDWVWWRASAVHSADVRYSALARYVGPDTFVGILKCPSDDGTRTNRHGSDPPYPYSYTINTLLTGSQFSYKRTVRLENVKNASTKILFAEEDERSLNDGGFWHAMPPSTGFDSLSIRHDYTRVNPDTLQAANKYRRGNVGFCDGHGEYVDRYFASQIQAFDPAL